MPETRRFEGPSDLHLHSIHSDGTESPAQVMAAAHRHGLRTAALTDHDTTSGWAEAAEAAASLGMTFIPGMELSAKHEWRSVHVLAYLIDPDDAGAAGDDRPHPLVAARARADDGRPHRRATSTCDWDDIVAQTSDGATVGRPHIADALVARGHRARSRRGVLEHPEPARRLLRRAVRARSGDRGRARRRRRRRADHRPSGRSRGPAADAAAGADAGRRARRIRARSSREPRGRHPHPAPDLRASATSS